MKKAMDIASLISLQPASDETAPSTMPSDQPAFRDDDYSAAHGESLRQTLDLDTWRPGIDLTQMYAVLEQEVAEAVRKEGEYIHEIRTKIFPRLRLRPGAPPGAGVFQVPVGRLEEVHRQVLFNGAVEACDGTVVTHDTLPVTITQIGVCLVSYRGDQGSWVHRIFRRDLRASSGKSAVEETLELLEHRNRRTGVDQKSPRDRLTELARRGILEYAERAVLLDRSDARWRLGHGSPVTFQLLTGSGMLELVQASLVLLRRLILDHRRFVFVPSAPSAREILTIGNALRPLEYAIVDTPLDALLSVADGGYRGEGWGPVGKDVKCFVKEVGPRIVVGVYRVSHLAPAQMFYAHVDHAHDAALIAMADSALQEHRGFPLLVDLADKLCTASFGGETLAASTRLAYAAAGAPYRYLAERKTR